MAILSRTLYIQTAIYYIEHLSLLNQYNRLIFNKLYCDENINDVYKIQMEFHIKNEAFEKCNILKQLFG